MGVTTSIFWGLQIPVSITSEGACTLMGSGCIFGLPVPTVQGRTQGPPSILPQSARGASGGAALNTRALVALVQLALWSQMLCSLNRGKQNGLPTASDQTAQAQHEPRLPWWFNDAQNGNCSVHMSVRTELSWGAAAGRACATALRQLHSARQRNLTEAQRTKTATP